MENKSNKKIDNITQFKEWKEGEWKSRFDNHIIKNEIMFYYMSFLEAPLIKKERKVELQNYVNDFFTSKELKVFVASKRTKIENFKKGIDIQMKIEKLEKFLDTGTLFKKKQLIKKLEKFYEVESAKDNEISYIQFKKDLINEKRNIKIIETSEKKNAETNKLRKEKSS